MDPRLKLKYYKDNNWEESMIQEAKRQVTELWKSSYKKNNTLESEECSDDTNDDLFSHIFKKQRTEEKDELNTYLNESTVSSKTDILVWWKVYFKIIYLLYDYYFNRIINK